MDGPLGGVQDFFDKLKNPTRVAKQEESDDLPFQKTLTLPSSPKPSKLTSQRSFRAQGSELPFGKTRTGPAGAANAERKFGRARTDIGNARSATATQDFAG